MRNKKLLFVCAAAGLLASCQDGGHSGQPEYPVLTVNTRNVELAEEYSASIRGRQDVEIYPQVSGTISRLCVHEGEKVKKGTLLFVIDQVPYQAALRTAVANVHAAEAQVETARLDYESKQMLFGEQVISEYEMSVARNALSVAEASLEQAMAQEIDARNSLSYTEIKSPSDGIVGTLPFRAGALVSPSMSTPLTTVSDNEQMYVYFSMTENQLRSLIRQYGSPDEMIRKMPEVQLRLNDGSVYESRGRIESISGVINPKTGTVSVRCVFPNRDRQLFSGGIGNVIVPQTMDGAVVIPQHSTFEIQDKVMAYKVVDGKAVSVQLSIGKLNDGHTYVVKEGLSQGDVIVSEGVGLLRDGQEIKVKQTVKP